jgi:hypothetical protein
MNSPKLIIHFQTIQKNKIRLVLDTSSSHTMFHMGLAWQTINKKRSNLYIALMHVYLSLSNLFILLQTICSVE